MRKENYMLKTILTLILVVAATVLGIVIVVGDDGSLIHRIFYVLTGVAFICLLIGTSSKVDRVASFIWAAAGYLLWAGMVRMAMSGHISLGACAIAVGLIFATMRLWPSFYRRIGILPPAPQKKSKRT
jgi:hypothetical protein